MESQGLVSKQELLCFPSKFRMPLQDCTNQNVMGEAMVYTDARVHSKGQWKRKARMQGKSVMQEGVEGCTLLEGSSKK